MSTMTLAARDSRTMLRRSLRRIIRYPGMTVTLLVMPIIFLLLFVFVFGGTLGAGLAVGGGRDEYVNYVVPAILLMTVTGAIQGTAISVAMDMTEGIIDRFRTMDISHGSVLTGHVVGSVIQSVASVGVVTLVALLVGFRPTAGPLEWLAVAGVAAMIALALGWMSVAFGLLSGNPESASNLPTLVVLLPFLGSGFVPTDSMPAALAWFAEYQPFTPMIETLRSLLMGTPMGASAWLTVGWCALIRVGCWIWSRNLFRRPKVR